MTDVFYKPIKSFNKIHYYRKLFCVKPDRKNCFFKFNLNFTFKPILLIGSSKQ